MTITKCVVCGGTVIITKHGEYDPRATHHWSYEKDGSKRPYCDGLCALVDRYNKKEE